MAPGPVGGPGGSGGAGQQGLRLALLFVGPLAAALAGDWALSVATGCVSICAACVDVPRQRKRWLPFPIYLLLVYAMQTSSYLLLPASYRDAFNASSGPLAASPSGSFFQGGSHPQPEDKIKTLSIVMAAFNEHQYMSRTLESIYKETPEAVLKEIIIIDDASSPPLSTVLANFPQVKVLRHETRKGLIKSKTEGGNVATGDAIMFLDAHVKPEPNWHLPLLRHMNTNYKRVVVPLIPILSGDTWEANLNAVGVKMMFDWTLYFQWFEDGNDLVPCMSGGLFGITRQWWHESGEYDYGMNMWGAENIEQSIRIWLCGGEIYVARDSKISHVFRPSFPYPINNTEIYINKVRTVEAWFDEYKENFYEADPAAKKFKRYMGSIDDRLKLKETLQCKPFKWYVEKFKQVFAMKHMLPEAHFLIRDSSRDLCVSMNSAMNGLVEEPCNEESIMQHWTPSVEGQGLRNAGANKCLDANAGSGPDKTGKDAFLYQCMARNLNQAWQIANGQIRWQTFCIQDGALKRLRLERCDNFLQARGPFEKVPVKTGAKVGDATAR